MFFLDSVFLSCHPFVYASYIRFQVAFDLKDKEKIPMEIEHLQKMIIYVESGQKSADTSTIELYRHYNILGFSYLIIQDDASAFNWFKKSLRERPTVENAAIYHLCILINRYLNF